MTNTTKIKPVAYMLVGVPGSGKSTWAEPYLARDFSLVSSDAYIEQRADEAGKTYGEVFQKYIKDATKYMEQCIRNYTAVLANIIWDQTNLTRKSRRKKIDTLIAAGYDVVAVTFEIPDSELTARRIARAEKTGKAVPPSILESMGKTYERPVRPEGFTKVIIVTPTEEYEATE